jgi:hypothetical protein
LEFVTLNTSSREQNHHLFKKSDNAPQKNIKLTVLLQKENKAKLPYSLANNIQIRTELLAAIIKFLLKYNTSAAKVLSSDMAVELIFKQTKK